MTPLVLWDTLRSSTAGPRTAGGARCSRATVAGLVGDLQAAWSSVRMDSPEVVRSYGEPGGVVIDPRTGASALQRSVSRGRLEPFQEAWRARNGALA